MTTEDASDRGQTTIGSDLLKNPSAPHKLILFLIGTDGTEQGEHSRGRGEHKQGGTQALKLTEATGAGGGGWSRVEGEG